MQLGLIGLGRMGGTMARRLMAGGHGIVAWDRSAEALETAARDGATSARSLDDLVKRLTPPRAVWIMVPAGDPAEQTVAALGQLQAELSDKQAMLGNSPKFVDRLLADLRPGSSGKR